MSSPTYQRSHCFISSPAIACHFQMAIIRVRIWNISLSQLISDTFQLNRYLQISNNFQRVMKKVLMMKRRMNKINIRAGNDVITLMNRWLVLKRLNWDKISFGICYRLVTRLENILPIIYHEDRDLLGLFPFSWTTMDSFTHTHLYLYWLSSVGQTCNHWPFN